MTIVAPTSEALGYLFVGSQVLVKPPVGMAHPDRVSRVTDKVVWAGPLQFCRKTGKGRGAAKGHQLLLLNNSSVPTSTRVSEIVKRAADLQVGDECYIIDTDKILCLSKVTHVTKQFVHTGLYRFKRDNGEGMGAAKGKWLMVKNEKTDQDAAARKAVRDLGLTLGGPTSLRRRMAAWGPGITEWDLIEVVSHIRQASTVQEAVTILQAWKRT